SRWGADFVAGLVLATAIVSPREPSLRGLFQPNSRNRRPAKAHGTCVALTHKALFGRGILLALEGQRQLARIDIAEQRARTLVEQVRVEIVGAQQRQPVLPGLALAAHPLELAREIRLLLGQVLLGLEPVRAGIRVDAEIPDDQRRDRV